MINKPCISEVIFLFKLEFQPKINYYEKKAWDNAAQNYITLVRNRYETKYLL